MTGTQSHEAMAGVTAAIEYLAELGRRLVDRDDRQHKPVPRRKIAMLKPDDSTARESQYDEIAAPNRPRAE